MTALKPITDAIDECLAANAVPVTIERRAPILDGYVDPPWLPTTEERIDETGEHPVASDHRPGRHAAPWTADHALADALDGLDRSACITPRHKDRARAFFVGPIPLLRDQIALAQWTITELTR